ncbi:hypothetical protein Pmani_036600 [Petrolisthes manimaculis]|uniref:Uncharacterized protein n=1 Tax=Petrolisthes manimaculis TaxID=1843537 RepID=A0AAE1NJA5_9EUCA|nr:hypothetical protein Pmani_036600 [Petrolisthes manimaculis]
MSGPISRSTTNDGRCWSDMMKAPVWLLLASGSGDGDSPWNGYPEKIGLICESPKAPADTAMVEVPARGPSLMASPSSPPPPPPSPPPQGLGRGRQGGYRRSECWARQKEALKLVCRSALTHLARTECAFHPKEARASEALWEGQLGAMRHWGDQASNSTCHFDH